MLNFMEFFVVTHNLLLQFILLIWFYGVIVMVNGRKIVPEEKAPLNRKQRREVPSGPLAAGTYRPKQKQHETQGKSMQFHGLYIEQIILTYLAKVFGKLLFKSMQHFTGDEMCKLLLLYIFPMIPSSFDISI